MATARISALRITGLALAALLAVPAGASAFCGFYVAGSSESLTNNATMVVMLREGTTTVLSMQNDYEGPPSAFALIVPVPVVIQEENVRTLPREVFARVDTLASPRLVEYWEQDPCAVMPDYAGLPMPAPSMARRSGSGGGAPGGLGVTVEAQFEVGEYEIVILSARDSDGLETWLRQEEYNIPEGASASLRPYVEQGTKFFVARVNVERVTFENGRAVLSPLRVHYESETFALPVRLGLLNSPGTQDLVVHILSRDGRYELANYQNVTIPTNLDVADGVRERFGEFYATLFDLTLERNPGAVVTEYAWQATSCDPCPGPVVTMQDLATLGADVAGALDAPTGGPGVRRGFPGMGGFFGSSPWVLTRLHYRYGADGLDEDLVFRHADPIVGGREFLQDDGVLEHGSRPAGDNNFQARYAIRHPWEGAIACENPVRGRWGGPPGEGRINQGSGPTSAAQNTAFAPRGNLQLAPMVRTDAPEVGLEAGLTSIADILSGAATAEAQEAPPANEEEAAPPLRPAPAADSGGCGGCAVQDREAPWGALMLLGLLFVRRARRR
ncbi:MAG: DUF2330 domain-containing protein [Sandaracinaceae bacterium]|nr:DUF2330 domain-containing protein [Sandaracinaceae bacterium]